MCRALWSRMQPTLRAQFENLYDRTVHPHDTLEQPVVDVAGSVGAEVLDSPSGRVTTEQEHDDGDREDGENWIDAATERALEQLPADHPLYIEDEPTTRH